MRAFPIMTLCISLLLLNCGGDKATTDASEIKVEDLVSNIDQVCHMDVSKVGIGDTTMHDNKMYGFCSTNCKESFVEDPASFLAN